MEDVVFVWILKKIRWEKEKEKKDITINTKLSESYYVIE